MPDTREVTSCSYVGHYLVRRDSLLAHLHHCLVIPQHPPLPLSKVGKTPSRHHDSGKLWTTGPMFGARGRPPMTFTLGENRSPGIAFIIPTEIRKQL